MKQIFIGIITMHKVLNYGSVLQAYSLQRYLSEAGYRNELINYIFPNGATKRKRTLKQKIKHVILNLGYGNFHKIKLRKFNQFYKNYYICSDHKYESPDELKQAHFNYDIYMTGSDQVWNPKHIKNDNSFFLDFADDSKPKMSYAASFSVDSIDNTLQDRYTKYLSRYNFISVREAAGVNIVLNLTHKQAELTCDPTLLLSKKDWMELIKKDKPLIKEPYILIYALRYSYNPYPEINKIISDIQNILKLRLVFLDGSMSDLFRKNSSVIKNAGPIDFLNLITNASFIITTSFHGTAFALNMEIPFYSVISRTNHDTRLSDLLKMIGADNRCIYHDDNDIKYELEMDFSKIRTNLNSFREISKNYLTSSISQLSKNLQNG